MPMHFPSPSNAIGPANSTSISSGAALPSSAAALLRLLRGKLAAAPNAAELEPLIAALQMQLAQKDDLIQDLQRYKDKWTKLKKDARGIKERELSTSTDVASTAKPSKSPDEARPTSEKR